MFTIGEFARLASVTNRALRHYEEIGLLHPARIDDLSGYRYYAAAQLGDLNRIAALQRLGFSLQDIGALLGSVTAEQLRGMLALRRSQVEEELVEKAAALADIEVRLRAIEREGAMPDYEFTIKPLPAIHFAALVAPVPGLGLSNTMEILQRETATLNACLAEAKVEPSGFWFACFDRTSDDEILAYFCFPVPDEVTVLPGEAAVYELARVPQALSVVRTLDEIEHYSEIYQEMAVWAEANGHVPVGDGRDIALDANTDGAGWVMETQWPLQSPDGALPPISPIPV